MNSEEEMRAEKVGGTNQPLSIESNAIHLQAQPEVAPLWQESHCPTDLQVPMDPSLLHKDGQTEQQPPFSATQTGDSDSSLLHSPPEITPPAYKTQIAVVSDLLQCSEEPVSFIDKNTGPLSTISSCLSQEPVSDLDCLGSAEALSPSYDLTGCFSLRSEPVPKDLDCQPQDSGISVNSCFGTAESISPLFDKPPHLSHSLSSAPSERISLPPETLSEFFFEHKSRLSSSFMQDGGTPRQLLEEISPLSDSLMGQSVTEPVSYHSSSPAEDDKVSGLFSFLAPLSGSLTEIVPATEPMTDLYIFESETQDFILSHQTPASDTHTEEIKHPEYLSQPWDKETEPDHDTHELTLSHLSLTEEVAQSHCCPSEEARVDSKSDQGQHAWLRPAAVAACEVDFVSVSDVSQTKAEDSGLNSEAWQNDGPNEVWLDACQYMAGEEKGNEDNGFQTILDRPGHFMMEGGVWTTTDTSSPAADSKVSNYSPDKSDGIGWSSSDMGGLGPPIERWSSVDSWASALSDWAAIISVPPEDITTAFTEIGAEIDALTQALVGAETQTYTETPDKADKLAETLKEGPSQEQAESDIQPHSLALQTEPPMAIQDQVLEPQPMPDSSILSGQSYFTSSFTEPAGLSVSPEPQDTEGNQTEESLTSTTQADKEHVEIQITRVDHCPSPTDKNSSLGASCPTLASPAAYSVALAEVAQIPGSTTSSSILNEVATDLPCLRENVEAMETDVFFSTTDDSIILNITEDSDEDLERQKTLAQLNIEEAFRDGMCKVTEEHSVSPPLLVSKKEGEGSYGATLTVSGFSPSEAEAPRVDSEVAEESKPSLDLHLSSTHTVTNTHVPGVDTPPGLQTNARTHVPSDTSQGFEAACQGEPQFPQGPQFIMPLAPLSISPALLCRTSKTLEGDQDCAKRFLNDNRGHSCANIQPRVLWPTFEGITSKSLLESKEKEQFIHKKTNTVRCVEESSLEEQKEKLNVHSDECLNRDLTSFTLSSGDTAECVHSSRTISTIAQEISDLSKELSNLAVVPGNNFLISEKDHIAYFTLDLDDPFVSRVTKPDTTGLRSDQAIDQPESNQEEAVNMPHKTHKGTSECKSRSKKEKSNGHHHPAQTSKKQENLSHHVPAHHAPKIQDTHPLKGGTPIKLDSLHGLENKEAGSMTVIETVVVTEKVATKSHSKKKKKHTQNTTAVKTEVEPLSGAENGVQQNTAKGRIDAFEGKLGAKSGKAKETSAGFPTKKDNVQSNSVVIKAQQPEAKAAELPHSTDHRDHQQTSSAGPLNDDAIKRRRLSENKLGKMVSVLESKLRKPEVSIQTQREEPKGDVGATRKKAYSEVVKQKSHTLKEDVKVVQPIQAESVSEDPQSLCLWCQFTAVFTDYTVSWSRDGTIMAEIKRSAGDESRVSLIISKASHKDLGKYQCRLSNSHGSVNLDYLLTYEVLSEIVIPASPKNLQPPPVEVEGEEEDIHCSRLMFREDFLSDQYFGENQPASIITEKVHFGEGMHRRAFRTKVQTGLVPILTPGHPCVLKVHNSVSYGTKNNEELIQKNFNLAVEECQVQNTAREYIKAYTAVAQSTEAFGDVPEIIPIYLVHRPSSDIPYATLEEELIGDFVKYSVRDGKEINLKRRDSEAGQKCCAFQHWVYQNTDGNLLVTDMQGVGMRLTDVGIATCKKGYKGFRGNCATTFIDQFKALHQCNKYCEILGLKSLQPKPKKSSSGHKPKPPPSAAPKKKTFGPTLKSKS